MKYYQPIKHNTYSRFKTDRMDESRMMKEVIKITEKSVLPHLKIITTNLHYLSGKQFEYCSGVTNNMITFLERYKYLTEKQFHLLLKVKQIVNDKIKFVNQF